MSTEPKNATIYRILTRGIIVKFTDTNTAFIHISRLSKQFISNIPDNFVIGQQVNVYETLNRECKPEYTLIPPTVPKPVTRTTTNIVHTNTLDDMIKRANKSLEDKMPVINKKSKFRSSWK